MRHRAPAMVAVVAYYDNDWGFAENLLGNNKSHCDLNYEKFSFLEKWFCWPVKPGTYRSYVLRLKRLAAAEAKLGAILPGDIPRKLLPVHNIITANFHSSTRNQSQSTYPTRGSVSGCGGAARRGDIQWRKTFRSADCHTKISIENRNNLLTFETKAMYNKLLNKCIDFQSFLRFAIKTVL